METSIELIEFESLLNHLQINRDQLICLGILVGTDYNPGGVKGIGAKTALEIVKKYQYPIKIFEFVHGSEKYKDRINFDWSEVYAEFKEYPCCTKGDIIFKKVNAKKLKEILLSRDFSEERIDSALEKLNEANDKNSQKTLF